MLKKIAIIFLLFIYATSTIGATVHLHYCMNKLVSTDLWHNDDSKACGKCGMTEKKGGCCKDEHKEYKLKTDHQKGSAFDFAKVFDTPILLTHSTNYNVTQPTKRVITYTNYRPPPLLQNCALHILYCSFLI